MWIWKASIAIAYDSTAPPFTRRNLLFMASDQSMWKEHFKLVLTKLRAVSMKLYLNKLSCTLSIFYFISVLLFAHPPMDNRSLPSAGSGLYSTANQSSFPTIPPPPLKLISRRQRIFKYPSHTMVTGLKDVSSQGTKSPIRLKTFHSLS